MVSLKVISAYSDALLQPELFKDYCPNGVQVEVVDRIGRIATAVTASLATIEAAAEIKADLLLVHHGYFWKGEQQTLTGMKGKRVAALFENHMSLMAYHLPLDAHPQLGNNAQLAKRMRWQNVSPVSENGLLWQTELPQPVTACEIMQLISGALNRDPLHIPGGPIQFSRIGWCTGAAQSYLEQAAALGLQAFISGEISEHTTHAARELGIHYFAAGHHATERYGIKALGEKLADEFGVEHQFLEISNPV